MRLEFVRPEPPRRVHTGEPCVTHTQGSTDGTGSEIACPEGGRKVGPIGCVEADPMGMALDVFEPAEILSLDRLGSGLERTST